MTNILVIDIGRQYGGAEKVTESIIKHIDTKSYNTYCLCLQDSKLYYKLIEEQQSLKGIKILTIPWSKKKVLEYFFSTIRFIKKYNIDIIHCHGVISSFVGSICGKLCRSVVITTIHGRADFDRDNGIKAKIFNILETCLSFLNDKYIAVSKNLSQYLCLKGVKKSKIVLIYNGIEKLNNKKNEEIDYKSKYFSCNDFMIVSIGRLTKVKGHIYLLKAVKKLLDKNIDVKCLIVGDGELKEYIEQYIDMNGLNQNIKIIGFNDDIYNILKSSDALVMSSLMEGLPIILLEALSCKTIVVAPSIGGIPEVINNDNGLLFEPGNIDELVLEIEKLKNGAINEEEIKEKGYHDFLNRWSIDKFIKSTEELYMQCMKDRKQDL